MTDEFVTRRQSRRRATKRGKTFELSREITEIVSKFFSSVEWNRRARECKKIRIMRETRAVTKNFDRFEKISTLTMQNHARARARIATCRVCLALSLFCAQSMSARERQFDSEIRQTEREIAKRIDHEKTQLHLQS